jgi:hypothetical protein
MISSLSDGGDDRYFPSSRHQKLNQNGVKRHNSDIFRREPGEREREREREKERERERERERKKEMTGRGVSQELFWVSVNQINLSRSR